MNTRIQLLQRINFYVNIYGSEIPLSERQKAEKILERVFKVSGYSKKELFSRKRNRELVAWRQLAMWLMVVYTKLSLKSIGEVLGGYDHSTVIHSRDLVNDMLEIKDTLFIGILNQYNFYGKS